MNNKPRLEKIVYDVIPILTTDSEKGIWNYLRYCENIQNLAEYYKLNTGLDANETRLKHVKHCLVHARNYFQSARDAAIDVRPLIMYYGISCFAKAIILFHSKKNPSKIRCLQSGHGLSLKWDSIEKGFDNISVEVDASGLFVELNDIIKNQGYFEALYGKDSSRYFKYHASDSTQLSGRQYAVKSLLSCLPDIYNHYNLNYKDRNNTLLLEDAIFSKNGGIPKVEYRLANFDAVSYKDVTVEDMKKYFPSRPCMHNMTFTIPMNNKLPPVYISLTHDKYLIGELASTFLHEYSVFFSVAYILGMLVRYRPEIWYEALSQRGNIIQGFIDLCQVKVPLLSLNILTQNIFCFTLSASSISIVTGFK